MDFQGLSPQRLHDKARWRLPGRECLHAARSSVCHRHCSQALSRGTEQWARRATPSEGRPTCSRHQPCPLRRLAAPRQETPRQRPASPPCSSLRQDDVARVPLPPRPTAPHPGSGLRLPEVTGYSTFKPARDTASEVTQRHTHAPNPSEIPETHLPGTGDSLSTGHVLSFHVHLQGQVSGEREENQGQVFTLTA